MLNKIRVSREISPEWNRLMQVAEKLGTGKTTITFNQGRPVMIEVLVKKINLDKDDDFDSKLKVIPII